MKILIIGASGYIGSHVAAVFADAGHEVSALHRPGGAPLPGRYRRIAGDLADPGSLTTAAAGYDRVIHAGAPIGDRTDRAGAEALLASGSPLLYTTGADGTLTITPADPAHYPGWAEWRVRLRGTDGAATDLPVPGRYRLIPAGVPAGPAANIAAVYREIAQAIAEGRPAHPNFGTAVHHHRTLAAIERAAQTGVRQSLAPEAEGMVA